MRRASSVLGLAVLLSLVLGATSAPAAGLSRHERAELGAGHRVERTLDFESGSNQYVGGIAYQVVKAEAGAVFSELSNVENLRRMLPNTLSARVVKNRRAESQGTTESTTARRNTAASHTAALNTAALNTAALNTAEQDAPQSSDSQAARPEQGLEREPLRVEIEQGVRPFVARYTILMQPSAPGEVRFWLDKSRPHDIEDVWGFLRVTPFGKHSLLTVATAIDLGPGLMGALFKDRVRALALRSATSIRDFVEPRCAPFSVASMDTSMDNSSRR